MSGTCDCCGTKRGRNEFKIAGGKISNCDNNWCRKRTKWFRWNSELVRQNNDILSQIKTLVAAEKGPHADGRWDLRAPAPHFERDVMEVWSETVPIYADTLYRNARYHARTEMIFREENGHLVTVFDNKKHTLDKGHLERCEICGDLWWPEMYNDCPYCGYYEEGPGEIYQ